MRRADRATLHGSTRGSDVESASASATAAAAACPSPMQGPITRTDANASRVAERQRPATARLSIRSGSRQRYGTVYQSPSSRKRHSRAPVGDVQLDRPCGAADAVVEAAAAEHVVLRRGDSDRGCDASRAARGAARCRTGTRRRIRACAGAGTRRSARPARGRAARRASAPPGRRRRRDVRRWRRGSSPPAPRPGARSGSGCRSAAADRRWRSGARAGRSARRAPAARDRGRRAACRTSSTGTGCVSPRSTGGARRARQRGVAGRVDEERRAHTRPGPRASRRWPRRPRRRSRARARGARAARGAGGGSSRTMVS